MKNDRARTKEIENLNPKLQMIVIKNNFHIISDMQKPCEEVLTYISNLSIKKKKELLSWGSNIQFIKIQIKNYKYM